MIHPSYEILLSSGIDAEYINVSSVEMCNMIVSHINDSGQKGIVAYCEWATVRVFFDAMHVCNVVCDDKGIMFEYDFRGPMFSDLRANRVVYSVILAVSEQSSSS